MTSEILRLVVTLASNLLENFPAELEALVPIVIEKSAGLHRFMGVGVSSASGSRALDLGNWAEYKHLIRTGLWLSYTRLCEMHPEPFNWDAHHTTLWMEARRYVRQETMGISTVNYDAKQRYRRRQVPGALAWDTWQESIQPDPLADQVEDHPQITALREVLSPVEFDCLWQQCALGRKQRELAADLVRQDPVRYGGPAGFKRAVSLIGKRSERAMRKARERVA